MSKQDLHDKVAIITGGSTEIAGAAALALANEGAKVCLCGKHANLLEIAARKIIESGGTCITTVRELDSLEAATSVTTLAQSSMGRLDFLIIVSPFWAGGHIHNHSVKTWDLVINANLRESFLMARAVLPLFREQRHGEIMAIGSDSGMGIYEQDGAFGVSMHAMHTLMDLIRAENHEFGIRTHLLAPGVALTDDLDSAGQPSLTASQVADWVVWLLTRPTHLRSNGPVLI